MLNGYPDILTVADITEILSIGKNRAYELLEHGSIKGFRIGRVWKVPKESLWEYIRVQCGLL